MGSDDITISEELEQAKDEPPPDATPGYNDAGKENENEELSPKLIEESETQLEPEKEREKSKSTNSPNLDELYEEYHNSFEQQEFNI